MKKTIADSLYNKKTIKRISEKNKLLGINYNYNIKNLLINHLIITILILVLCTIFKIDFIISLFLSAIYFFSAEYFFFDLRLMKRAKLLEKESLFYFQVLALSLESGTNLKRAIEITSKNIDNTLSNEFKKVTEDVYLGKSLTESLNDLKLRIPSDTVNNIIINLLESNIYGNNMIDSLNNQLDYLSDKLVLETKAKINKMPTKISIVSVLIFIPLMILLLVSPFLLTLLNQ